jgi:RecB family exonuclease
MKIPEHISYSQFNTYTQCPRNWYLSYIRKAQQVQTWYLPIGTAVHQMVEEHLKGVPRYDGQPPKAEDFFYPLVSAQMEIEPDLPKWVAGGKKDDPCVEGKALQKVKDCFEKALEFLGDVDVWEVEFDASGSLPGLSVPIKAFVDIIGEHKKHGPVILDWKTGSKKPKDNFQLETYAALLKMSEYGRRAKLADIKGLWAMLDPGAAVARPMDLSAVDPAEVGAKYQKVREGMESMQIQAKPKFMCKMCFNAPNCMEYSGLTARSIYYDRSHGDQPPY